ncbi:MAG TPA: hypothetical protein VM286_01510 [Candidatus Thermoplasmatota archaeon]|nr:hypothetical protein [Candidatus Thermoplasmatota archaeon]
MRSLLLAPFLCAVLLLAGCATKVDTPSTTTAQKQLDEGVDRLDLPVLPRAAPPAGERTLGKAPQWRLGEYWQYHLVDGFTGTTYEFTRIVAGTDGPNYLVGFPAEAFWNDILVLHIPGFGDVAQADLSFDTHNVNFAPTRFPLTETTTWATAFEGRPGNVTAEPHPDGTATLTGAGAGWGFTATYDAEAGEITKMDYPGYAKYEVTKHGFGYTGVVRVPHAHELVFQHGRIAGVLNINAPLAQPKPESSVTETVQVEPGFDHLAFVIIVGNAVGAAAAGGYYDEKVVSPNGTAFELTMLPNEMTTNGLKLAFFGTGDPTGPWTLTHTAAGPGLTMAEGIGYHSIDVQLPSGCVVKSFNANHHTAPCKVDAVAAATMTQASK